MSDGFHGVIWGLLQTRDRTASRGERAVPARLGRNILVAEVFALAVPNECLMHSWLREPIHALPCRLAPVPPPL